MFAFAFSMFAQPAVDAASRCVSLYLSDLRSHEEQDRAASSAWGLSVEDELAEMLGDFA